MDPQQLFSDFLQAQGLHLTSQRHEVLEAFWEADHHLSVEQLVSQLRSRASTVGQTTVYRTLKLLTECGVAFERRFGDGLTRYELADDESHHDHLICVECGDIIEFEEPRIETLQEEIAALDLASVDPEPWEEVVDPGGGEQDVFHRCAAELDVLVDQLVDALGARVGHQSSSR